MTPRLLVRQYPCSSGAPGGETNGAPKFPSCPFERMPCSQTPVVSCSLAMSLSGLLPSVSPTTSAFPGFLSRLSLVHDHILFRGSITRPAFLFYPVPYVHYWFCTWVSLLTCWLGFDQMGFELRRVSRLAPIGQHCQISRICYAFFISFPDVSGFSWHNGDGIVIKDIIQPGHI